MLLQGSNQLSQGVPHIGVMCAARYSQRRQRQAASPDDPWAIFRSPDVSDPRIVGPQLTVAVSSAPALGVAGASRLGLSAE